MEFTLYSDFADELEPEWNSLLAESDSHVPFMRYEYLKAWWQTRGGGEWPQDAGVAIIAGREHGRLVGIAPLFFAEWEGKPTLLLLGSIEISDYLDLIARPEDMDRFVLALLDYLGSTGSELPQWSRLDLYNVFDSSPTLPALERAAAASNKRYNCEPFRPSLYIPLPGDWETYLAGIDKKQRHEIRRKMRRAYALEKPVRWYSVTDADTLEAEIDGFLQLMAHDEEKAQFLKAAMRENFRVTIRCAFEAGCLHLAFLEIGGEKAAAYLSFDYLERLWVYNSGLDPQFMEYSPGWVLLGEILKWANENGRKGFDFMRGDEDYKFRFGAQKRDVMRATIEK